MMEIDSSDSLTSLEKIPKKNPSKKSANDLVGGSSAPEGNLIPEFL